MENEYIVSFLKPNAINTPSAEGITAPNTHELLLPLARLELDSEGGHSYESFVNTAAFDHESGENGKLDIASTLQIMQKLTTGLFHLNL